LWLKCYNDQLQGPDKVPAAEHCPHCGHIVRTAREIWFDELEEEILNARCLARMLEADKKIDKRLQNFKVKQKKKSIKKKASAQKSVVPRDVIGFYPNKEAKYFEDA